MTTAHVELPSRVKELGSLPDILLPYQRNLLAATSTSKVTVYEKSRRIGATWGVGADAVLTAGAARSAGGSDVFYIGYNRDMTREFIDTCAMWARAFAHAAVDVEEFLFEDRGEHGDDRSIQAFRIRFASTFEIVALCSRPRSLRGRQGYVIIDEAAFHDDLAELLKAAFALLIWGGKVLVISTHDGVDNAFNELVTEIRAGKRPGYKLLRTTFEDALRDGLFGRVCLAKGETPSDAAEATWAGEIRSIYGDAASEELDCIPRNGGGRFLPRTLLEARAVDVPVLRWACTDAFVDESDDERALACAMWFEANVRPALASIASGVTSYLGQDFGRSGDLTVMWPLTLDATMRRHTPFTIELRNVPFRQQEQILFALCDALPDFRGAALDARGNGQSLAEFARQRYGSECVEGVMLSEPWYREHMPPFKAALEDATVDIPRDAETVDDLRQLEVVNGVARVAETRTKGASGQRHGDAAIAAALALYASSHLDAGPQHVAAMSGGNVASGSFAGHPELDDRNMAGWIDT